LDDCVSTIKAELGSQANDVLEAEVQSQRLFSQYQKLQFQTILEHYAVLSRDLQTVQDQKEAQEAALSTANCQREQLKIQLDAMQKEHEVTRRQASEYSAYWEESKAKEDELKRKMETREKQHKTETEATKERCNKAQESIAKLTSTLQQRATSEEALRAELDQWVVYFFSLSLP
jgi:chromosome segregation ATPase